MRKSTRKKAELVEGLVKKYYEPGRQDKCKEQIYRNIISKQMGISRRTFFRLLKIARSFEKEKNEN